MAQDSGDVAIGWTHNLPDGAVGLQLRLRPDEVPPGKLTCTVRAPGGHEWSAQRAYLRSGRSPFVAQFALPRDFVDAEDWPAIEHETYEAVWQWRSAGVPQRCTVLFEYPPQRP